MIRIPEFDQSITNLETFHRKVPRSEIDIFKNCPNKEEFLKEHIEDFLYPILLDREENIITEISNDFFTPNVLNYFMRTIIAKNDNVELLQRFEFF